MGKKPSLKDINTALHTSNVKKDSQSKAITANVPRGERANFLKVTITLEPQMWESLRNVGTQRKAVGKRDTDVSSLIREAVAEWLRKRENS